MTTVTNPDLDTITLLFPVDPSQNDSSDNDYLHMTNDIILGHGKEGAYGALWGSVSLPSTPSQFKWCFRRNTDTGTSRLYYYNGTSWEYIEFQAIGVTTTETGVTSTGAGTAIDYGSSSPRSKHTMQIVANANAGSIDEVEVDFEGSLDGAEFFPLFSIFIKDVASGSFNHIQKSPEIPLVEIRRNVTFFDKAGDADIDIILTSM